MLSTLNFIDFKCNVPFNDHLIACASRPIMYSKT